MAETKQKQMSLAEMIKIAMLVLKIAQQVLKSQKLDK